jgi:hypothetical protein
MADARSSGALHREDQKLALLDAAQAAVQDAHDKAANRRGITSSNTSRIVVTVLGLAIFAVGIYILAMRPTWFFTPPPPPESIQIQEASVRLMLVREASRVRRYRSEHGKLPETLQDAGSTINTISYTAQGDSAFRLVTSWGEKTIGLSSSDSVGTFLGNSLKVIASRGRP